jgi:cellulose synthase operon protein C
MGSIDNSGSGALDERVVPGLGQLTQDKPASFRREVTNRPSSRRAFLASLQAQLHVAREAGDIESERALATKLARALVHAGTQLDTATRLARRSLLLGDDPKLREELSAWFASLGRLNLASGTLEPLLERQLSGADRARLWVRIAVLRARAGEAEASAEALREAAAADSNDPLPLELFAAIRAFAPHAVSSVQAASALLSAADLRDAHGDERAALEDLLQALTLRPEHPEAVERMVRHLASIGRAQAADEVWRRCATALPQREARTVAIHERRVREALEAQLPAVAFGAALDAEADRELDSERIADALELVNDGSGFVPVPHFDGMLHCLGLTEWLLARALRVGVEQDVAEELTLQCARVLSGPLGNVERVPGLLSDCLLRYPAADKVFVALEEYASTSGDSAVLADIIVALGQKRMDHPATHRRLAYWATLSELKQLDPGVAVWALDKLEARGSLSVEQADLRVKLQVRMAELSYPPLEQWPDLPVADVRRLVDTLGRRPAEARAFEAGLLEMCSRDPSGVRWYRMRERQLVSAGREADVQAMWQTELSRANLDASVCRLGMLRSFQRSGQSTGVLQLLTELLAQPEAAETVGAEEAAVYATVTSEVGSDTERAQALELVAYAAKPAVGAVILAVVAGLYLRHGKQTQALHAAERACRTDSGSARAFVACADALGETDTRVAGVVFERASRLVLPRVAWCRGLARVAQAQANEEMRLKWLRRWASLAPLDTEAATALLEQLCNGNDAESLEGALDWLLAQPRTRLEFVQPLCRAVERLSVLSKARCSVVARRLIGVFGLGDERLVETLERVASSLEDYALRVSLAERRLVHAAGPREQIALYFAAAENRVLAGEVDLAVGNLVSALGLGASAKEVHDRLVTMPARTSSDAYIGELTIRLAWLRQTEVESSDAVRAVQKELATAYRDFAGDKNAACRVLEQGCDDKTVDGLAIVFRDWVESVGIADAARYLEARTLGLPREQQVTWRRAASRVALAANAKPIALSLALPVLDFAHAQTEILAIVEAALPLEESARLDEVYERVHQSLLGCYGERALHYRAACELERRNLRHKALEHAEAAFLAVPTEGIAFALMSRLASGLGGTGRIVQAIHRVADNASYSAQREYWLARAASLSAEDTAGLSDRLEVLLRALSVRADVEALKQVAFVMRQLGEHHPGMQTELCERLDATARAGLRPLDATDGAAVAVCAAVTFVTLFADHERAAAFLALAIELDATVPALDEWAAEHPTMLDSEAIGAVLTMTLHQLELGKNVSTAFLRWCRRLAEKGRPEVLSALLVAIAKAAPADAETIAEARRLAASDKRLMQQLDEVVPMVERTSKLLAEVEALGSPELSAQHLDREVRKLRARTEWFPPVFECLRKLASTDLAASKQVEATLAYITTQLDISVELRAEAARFWVDLLIRRDAHFDALAILQTLSQWRQLTVADQRLGAELARKAYDEELELSFLGQVELAEVALEGDAGRVLERVAVLERIAELHAASGSRKQARHYYERVLSLQPNNEVAQAFLLSDAEHAEDFDALAQHLEEQLVLQSGEPSVALKLFQVYTQRLNDPNRGRKVLAKAIDLYGDDEELLCALAAHLDATGQNSEAAQIYQKASRGSRQHFRASQFAELACRSYMKAGEDENVHAILSVKGLYPNTQPLAELRVELARKQGKADELVGALEELSVVSKEPASKRAAYLMEAAEVALQQLNSTDRALALAERGSRMAPAHVPLQLLARSLQYRRSGVGSRQDALYTITELRSLRPGAGNTQHGSGPNLETAAAQGEMRAFLLAEALTRRSGAQAGLKELREAEAQFGLLPLIALGLAERLAQSPLASERREALSHYEHALIGDLRNLRSPARVALDAAALAVDLGVNDRAVAFAARIDEHNPLAQAAKELTGKLPLLSRPPSKPKKKSVNQEAPVSSVNTTGERQSSGDVPAMIGRVHIKRLVVNPAEAPGGHGADLGADPFEAAKDELHRMSQPPPEPQSLRHSLALGQPPPKPASVRGDQMASSSAVVTPPKTRRGPSVVVSPSLAVGRPVVIAEDTSPEDTLIQPPQSARQSLVPSSAMEQRLMMALNAGSVDAGHELLGLLKRSAKRTHEILGVSRLLAHWLPGDEAILVGLRDAALADNDPVFARSLLHAQRALSDPAHAPVAPALHRQTEHAEAMVQLLAGPSQPGHEALGLVWQHVPDLFRETGPGPALERKVEQGGGTPLGELLLEVARLFGVARVGVYQVPADTSPEFELVLTHPAALVIRGVITCESPSFRYHFGRMMFATRPEFALAFGLEEKELATVLGAIAIGFGPPRRLAGDVAQLARLAERFWEMLPPNAQRRLGELCEVPAVLDPWAVLEGARRALRRAGLFVCGDLGVAVRETAVAEGVDVEGKSLRQLCQESEVIADVVRFATSMEYADARWRSGATRTGSTARPVG